MTNKLQLPIKNEMLGLKASNEAILAHLQSEFSKLKTGILRFPFLHDQE